MLRIKGIVRHDRSQVSSEVSWSLDRVYNLEPDVNQEFPSLNSGSLARQP